MLRARSHASRLSSLASQLLAADGAAAAGAAGEAACVARALSGLASAPSTSGRLFSAASCAPALARPSQAAGGGSHRRHQQQQIQPHRFASSWGWWGRGGDGELIEDVPQPPAAAADNLGNGDASPLSSGDAGVSGGGGGDAGASGDLVDADTIVSVAGLAEGDALAAAAEASWYPTMAVEKMLAFVHHDLGVEWWEAICGVTVGARLLTVPLVIMTIRSAHKMAIVRPEVEALNERMKEAQMAGTYDKQEHQRLMADVWKRHKTNPLAPLGPMFFNGFLFVTFYRSIINLAEAKVPSMMVGGTAWFPDLTSADPTLALPILCGATMLLTAELGAADGMDGMEETARQRMKWMLRVFSVMVPALTYTFPAGVFVYWSTSNLYSLAQSTLFRNPVIRATLRLPAVKKKPAADVPAEVSRIVSQLSSARAAAAATPGAAGAAAHAVGHAIADGKVVQTFTTRKKKKKSKK